MFMSFLCLVSTSHRSQRHRQATKGLDPPVEGHSMGGREYGMADRRPKASDARETD